MNKKKILIVIVIVMFTIAGNWAYKKYQIIKDAEVLTPEQMSMKYRE